MLDWLMSCLFDVMIAIYDITDFVAPNCKSTGPSKLFSPCVQLWVEGPREKRPATDSFISSSKNFYAIIYNLFMTYGISGHHVPITSTDAVAYLIRSR